MATFPARLVTPERVLFDDEVTEVMLRVDGGDITFLVGHSPFVGAVVPGPARFRSEQGDDTKVALHGGFVHVDGETLIIVSPVAELAADIDPDRARHSLEAAEARVADLAATGRVGHGGDEDGDVVDEEVLEAEQAAERARTRLTVVEAP